MNIIEKGHVYQADNFESKGAQLIHFIKKEPVSEGSNELKIVNEGTTNEEVLKVLIDRVQFLNGKFPCRENSIVITKLQEALMWLEARTKDRQNRDVEGKHTK